MDLFILVIVIIPVLMACVGGCAYGMIRFLQYVTGEFNEDLLRENADLKNRLSKAELKNRRYEIEANNRAAKTEHFINNAESVLLKKEKNPPSSN